MSTRNAVVVIRHLKDHKPTTAAVIMAPSFLPGYRGTEKEWLEQEANKRIEDMKKLFIEFEKADFYINHVEIDCDPSIDD